MSMLQSASPLPSCACRLVEWWSSTPLALKVLHHIRGHRASVHAPHEARVTAKPQGRHAARRR